MHTGDALLCAIAARPDDDTARLAYADWLEENGEPDRAEFIRVECASARTDRSAPEYMQLVRRSSRLMGLHAHRWFGPLAGEDVVVRVLTERGFIDTAVLAPGAFVDHADLLFQYAPLLRELHVTDGGDWAAFFAAPRLESIRALSFEDEVFTLEAAEELAASDRIRGLLKLEIDRQPLGPDEMAAVASAPLWSLEELSTSECGIGDGGARELFAGEAFGKVRDLDLSENGLTDAACRALAAATGFGRLEQLALCQNHITAAGIAALTSAAHLGRLRSLNLYGNPIGPDGGRAILASRHLGGLTDLNLIGCGVGIEVVEHLRWVYGGPAVKA